MAPEIKALGIDRMSIDDRLALVEAIWDSIAADVEQAPLTEIQREELERRLADSIARPDAVTPWEEVKARALARGAPVTLPIVLRAEAEAEFDEAFDWYETQRPGLGIQFAACIQQVLDRIAANPHLHAPVFADVRKGVARRFPYSVFYRAETARVEVLAVFHNRRNPAIWQGRA